MEMETAAPAAQPSEAMDVEKVLFFRFNVLDWWPTQFLNQSTATKPDESKEEAEKKSDAASASEAATSEDATTNVPEVCFARRCQRFSF